MRPLRDLLPPRPAYRKEWLLVGYPLLWSFAVLLLSRFLFAESAPNFIAKFFLELLVFALPVAVFVGLRGKGYLPALRIRSPRAQHIPLLLSAVFALLAGALVLSMLCGGIFSLGNSAAVFEETPALTPMRAIATVLILGVLPAVCEELMFRGVLIAEYERRGAVRAVLMSSLAFALVHFDIHNLPVYLYAGVLLALVLFATHSLVATVLLHALYNVVLLFGQHYLNALYMFTGSVELFLFCLILVWLVALLLFCRFAARLYAARAENGVREPRRSVPLSLQLYTTLDALADPPFLASLAIAVVGLIAFA